MTEMEREVLAKLLSENYFDATNTIRHYDTLRATFSSLSLSALALLAGIAAAQIKGGSPETIRSLAILGLLISLLSMIVVIKLNSLILRQRLRARVSIQHLEESSGIVSISRVDQEVRDSSRAWPMNAISLGSLWIGLFMILLVINAIATIFPFRLVVH